MFLHTSGSTAVHAGAPACVPAPEAFLSARCACESNVRTYREDLTAASALDMGETEPAVPSCEVWV